VTVSGPNDAGLPCQAVFQVAAAGEPFAEDAGTSAAYLCGDPSTVLGGCPTGDAGGGRCTYIVFFGIDPKAEFDMRVAQPGYEPQVVSGVHGGVEGCVPTVAASAIAVTLQPSDGGDGG
jgi:hypothetical protein